MRKPRKFKVLPAAFKVLGECQNQNRKQVVKASDPAPSLLNGGVHYRPRYPQFSDVMLQPGLGGASLGRRQVFFFAP